MQFAWDELKNRSNEQKHGLGFDLATLVFLDPMHLTRLDQIVQGELRWRTIGRVAGTLIVVVVYVVIDEETEFLRIISARKATRQERFEYEEASEE